jgi:hypothetical protein
MRSIQLLESEFTGEEIKNVAALLILGEILARTINIYITADLIFSSDENHGRVKFSKIVENVKLYEKNLNNFAKSFIFGSYHIIILFCAAFY